MNTIFHSEANDGNRIALNGNKIIIVSENASDWSQEYNVNKNDTSLQAVNDAIDTIMEPNSNDAEDEADPLNAGKNIMVSEDSSDWSQDLITVNKRQAPLSDINDTNAVLMEDSKEYKNKKQLVNENYLNENTSEMSNSQPFSEDTKDKDNKRASLEEIDPNILRCRTCLCIVDSDEVNPLYTVEPSGETLKELLIYLIPQMASTLCDEDIVCKQCDNNIKFCVEFIDNCMKVETELLNECEESVGEVEDNQEESREYEAKFIPTHNLDHDYMPEVKVEDETLMETEDSPMTENLLSNDDPNLASREEYLFECFRCGETFESETALDEHARVEHGILKEINSPTKQEERIYYKCNSCEVLFATKAAYNVHVKTSHKETVTQSVKKLTYTCKECGKKYFYLGDLFEHKRKVHGFSCSICPERFNTKGDLDKHMETHPDLYYCEICNKGFKTRKALSNHVKLHDSEEMNLCNECGHNFNSQEELEEHLKETDHTHIESLIKLFPCNLCNVSFTDRRSLNSHKQGCHGYVREYLCTVCDKNFSSKTSLDSHFRLKHAEVKPFQCERCGERFARLDYLRRHNDCTESMPCKKFMKGPRRKFRYTKADGEPIKCKLCGKVFKDVYLLKLHLTTHTNLRRFRCSVCNLTFTTNKNRERHEKIHDDPLSKYRCTVCWKRTQSQEELDNHILSHAKKYQCHVCHESFARVYLLNYHVSEVHADDDDVEKEKQIVFTEGLKEYLLEY